MSPKDMKYDCDVAVVGCGPTGATLANLLASCGVQTLVLERQSDQYLLPRAVHLDDEVMRVLQTVGISEEFKELIRINPGMRFLDQRGKLLLDWPRPQEVSRHGWNASFRFHQPDLEKLLRQKLHNHSNVAFKADCEVIGLSEDETGVTISYREKDSEADSQVRAKFVVGCDGANSFVRKHLEIEMDDLGFHERWLVVDFVLKHEMPQLGDFSLQYCVPERPMTYCRGPRNRRRWELKIHDNECARDVTDAGYVWDLLSRWITPEDAELERSVVYTFNSAIAQDWRKGRLMIAGDAAHLTPPFMGQGMCAGVRDASNLAWKLALCSHDMVPASILDTYTQERVPPARTYVETAIRLGGLINTLDNGSAMGIAEQKQSEPAVMRSIQPPLGSVKNPLFGATATANQGKIFGQPRLADGHLLDDAIGYAPVLLSRSPIVAAHTGLKVIDASEHPNVGKQLEEFGAYAVLLRPDRFVLADAQTQEEAQELAAIPFPSPLKISDI